MSYPHIQWLYPQIWRSTPQIWTWSHLVSPVTTTDFSPLSLAVRIPEALGTVRDIPKPRPDPVATFWRGTAGGDAGYRCLNMGLMGFDGDLIVAYLSEKWMVIFKGISLWSGSVCYWTWWFIVDLPNFKMVIFHCCVNVYQRLNEGSPKWMVYKNYQ